MSEFLERSHTAGTSGAASQAVGRQSIGFTRPPAILGGASVVGSKEGDGPLGHLFDRVNEDPLCGKSTWEQAESALQKEAADLAIERAGLVRRIAPNATIHCDAVQAYGKLPLKVEKLPIDLVSMSGHKIHAPKGIGALYVKKGTRIDPIIYGGAQQNGLRPGTESLPLACGMGYAAKLRAETIRQDWETVTRLQAYAREKLSAIPGIVLNSPEQAFPYILNFSAEGIRSETMLHHLEQYGIYVSNASACGKGAASHVLDAMGLSHRRIDSAIRLSFNAQNTEADIDAFLEKLRLGLDTLARARS